MWFRRQKSASVASVVFDASGYEDLGVHDGRHIWRTPQGDGIALYFFSVSPDLPQRARSCDDLRQFYTSRLAGTAGELVELHLVPMDGHSSIRTILKTPQEPSGMTYVGAITIPFRDFSFVLKAQCQEHGPTGIREAVLLDRMLEQGEVASGGSGPVLECSSPDDSRFDADFPSHPLSRLRGILGQVERSIRLSAPLKLLPPFPLPEDGLC